MIGLATCVAVNFKEPHTKSSKYSAFVESQKKVSKIDKFEKGEWWVQDFASMLPLAFNSKTKNLNILDICAAPGGKAFQVLSNNKVVLNDVNNKRIFFTNESYQTFLYNAIFYLI